MAGRYRPDIEGLRAVAVMLAVTAHVFGVLPGGVLGVDVFFVISGFLITGMLVNELERSGRVRLGAFVARRVRRLAPLSITVVLVTLAVLVPLSLASERASLLQHAFATLTGVENWHLMKLLGNYRAAQAGASPFQHFWSLAVEEQFYVVLPLAVVGCAAAAKVAKRPGIARALLAAALAAALVVSVLYCIRQADQDPGKLYLNTIGRTWELAAGALAALVTRWAVRVPPAVAGLLTLAGLTAIVSSAVLVADEDVVPWPGAVPAVLGTVAIVATGSRAPVWCTVALTNPVSRAIGRMSFALYLWHFPVLVAFDVLWGSDGVLAGIVLGLSFVLAAVTHRWVEVPARRSTMLSFLERPSRRRAHLGAAVVAPSLAVLMLTSIVVQEQVPVLRDSSLLARQFVLSGADEPLGRFDAEHLSTELRDRVQEPFDAAAFDAATVPAVRGTELSQCGSSPRPGVDPKVCVDGAADAPKRVWLVGDSTAAAWADAVRAALPREAWELSVISVLGCPLVDVDAWRDGPVELTACRDMRSRTLAAAVEAAPDLVIVSSHDWPMGHLRSGATGSDAASEWSAGIDRTIDVLAGSAASVVFLTPPPTAADPARCATFARGLARCTADLPEESSLRVAAEAESVARARAAGRPVAVIDTRSWFCSAAGQCPAVIDGTVVRRDSDHIAPGMAQRLVDLIRTNVAEVAPALFENEEPSTVTTMTR